MGSRDEQGAGRELELGHRGDSREATARVLERGHMVGRYVILRHLASGGMGVVYEAYDRKLDRRIVLKLLHTSRARDEDARLRLLREAQALAKLSHPNVVAVYDVDTFEDQVYIAMEYVAGKPLNQWLEATERTREQVLEVFLPAGRGLAAAHDAGLVHRDFKPENVVVSPDGRVRVLDFGLAALAEEPQENAARQDETDEFGITAISPSSTELNTPLTQTGQKLGTPRFMAPEQHAGRHAGAAADQFAYCVALHFALCGSYPFRGDTYLDLATNVLSGAVVTPPKEIPLPRRGRAALLRGLNADPERRFPSMGELLDELAPRSRALVGAVALGVVLLGAGAAIALLASGDHAPTVCRGAEAHLVGVWDDEVKESTRRAFRATQREHAPDTLDRVEALLDQRAHKWAEMRTEVCRATRVRGEQSERVMDLRMNCLDRRLRETRALTELFCRADKEVVDQAVTAVLDLAPLSECADSAKLALATDLPGDPAVRARIEALFALADELKAIAAAGEFDAALEALQPLTSEARGLGYPPLTAELLEQMAVIQSRLGLLSDAEQSAREAIALAADAGDDALLSRTANDLLYLVGPLQFRFEESLAMVPLVDGYVRRAGDRPDDRVDLLATKGYALLRTGDDLGAIDTLEQALSVADGNAEARNGRVAHVLNYLAIAYDQADRKPEARKAFERALALRESQLGSKHPAILVALTNLGAFLSRTDADAAASYLERGLRIAEQSYGDHHIKTARVAANLGQVRHEQGRCEDALKLYDRALAIYREAEGRNDMEMATVLTAKGRCLTAVERSAEAVPILEQALAMRSDNAGAALTRFALAEAIWATGSDRARAVRLSEKARSEVDDSSAQGAELAREIEAWQARTRVGAPPGRRDR